MTTFLKRIRAKDKVSINGSKNFYEVVIGKVPYFCFLIKIPIGEEIDFSLGHRSLMRRDQVPIINSQNRSYFNSLTGDVYNFLFCDVSQVTGLKGYRSVLLD